MTIRPITMTVGGKLSDTAITHPYPEDDGFTYQVPLYGMKVVGTTDDGKRAERAFKVLRFGLHRKSKVGPPQMVGLSAFQTHTIKAWLPTYTVHSFPSVEDGAWQVTGNFLIHDGPDNPMTENYASIGCVEICGGPLGFVQFNDFLISLSGAPGPTRGQKLSQMGGARQMKITYSPAPHPAIVKY